MKRILYINEIGELAGAERALVSLVRRLDPQRYQCFVACPAGPLGDALRALGIILIPFDFRMRKLKTGTPFKSTWRVVNPLALLYKIFEGLKLARIVRQHRIDLLHTISLSAHVAGLVAARLTGSPILWHIHTFFPSWLYRFVLADRLVFVSRNALVAALGDSPPPIAGVVYNAEDFTLYDPDQCSYHNLRQSFGLNSGQPVVLVISRISPEKNLENILNAWPHTLKQRPDARLVIVGSAMDGQQAYREAMEQLVRQLSIEDSVIFAGWRNDVADLLYTADVFAFPSENDTAGRSVLEAMAMRKPVVAVRAGGVPELLVSGESGLLVERDDAAEFGSTIGRLLTDPEQQNRLGDAARRHVLTHFAIEEHVQRFETMYSQLIDDDSPEA